VLQKRTTWSIPALAKCLKMRQRMALDSLKSSTTAQEKGKGIGWLSTLDGPLS
jgi:hypothetical protein